MGREWVGMMGVAEWVEVKNRADGWAWVRWVMGQREVQIGWGWW